MDQIIKDVDEKIRLAEEQYNEEFNRSYDQDSSKNDETHKNVQKLENKVNNLAKSVHDLFVQFDTLSKKVEAPALNVKDSYKMQSELSSPMMKSPG